MYRKQQCIETTYFVFERHSQSLSFIVQWFRKQYHSLLVYLLLFFKSFNVQSLILILTRAFHV